MRNESSPSQPDKGDSRPLLPLTYQNLETPRSFRLLQLHRNYLGSSLNQFTGTLKQHDLDRCPPFTALSYVWGDPSRTVPFECDGKILHVTQNCYYALERLIRRRCKRKVWVDATCIDQSNVSEKSSQVALMGDVYTTARHIMIWLGRGSAAADEGMQRLWRCATVHYLATCKGPFRKRRMRAYMVYIEKGFGKSLPMPPNHVLT